MFALLAGALAHHFAAADLEDAAGRARLREALEAGGDLRRLYIQLLTPALDRLDRFLGDADKASFSLLSPFGNREARPYWTAWSFDRCALLALIYPLLSLFVVWVWTGESGPIAEFLGMKYGTSWWFRSIAAALLIVSVFAYWRALRTTGWRGLLWFAAFAVAGAGAVALAVAGTFAFALAVVGAGAGAGAVAGAFAGAGAVTVTGAVAVAVAVAVAGAVVGAGAFAGAIVGAAAATAAAAIKYCERHNVLGWFWAIYWPIVLALCYIVLIGAARSNAGPTALSFVLMFALVPIVNVPFDWASLGFTRALLRRGAEDGAPSPLWLGLIDFAFGLFLLVLLTLTLIGALQWADAVIVYFGGVAVADVVPLLDNIAEDPRDPTNYWAYATLFSTLIPSALNAVIGAVSLIGWGWRPAREWALTQIRALDREDAKGIRVRVSAVLAIQVGIGTALTCLVLWGLWEVLLEFPFVFPFVIALLKQFALALA
jgi:hypothetical protein